VNQWVKISRLGYKSKTFSVSNFQNLNEVRLEQSVTLLNEVILKAKKTKIKIVGNNTKTCQLVLRKTV